MKAALIGTAALVAVLAAVATDAGDAFAQAPPYVGTWASRTAQCRVGQESQNAPLIMRRDGYDQHEAHCKFTSVRAQGPAWAVKAQCMVEGDTQNMDLVLQVSGNRLTIRDEAGARTLERCR
ncbi:MAG: hypothetical protein QOI12_1956 [Alphaproteobacteria bacterium]|jgi:hypothetical protein|nr:hypothetical protein [Alphaproteobacteria bacterium]